MLTLLAAKVILIEVSDPFQATVQNRLGDVQQFLLFPGVCLRETMNFS